MLVCDDFPRQKVKHTALEALALINSKIPSKVVKILAEVKLDDDINEIMTLRFQRGKQGLPSVGEDGIVQIRPSTYSPEENKPNQPQPSRWSAIPITHVDNRPIRNQETPLPRPQLTQNGYLPGEVIAHEHTSAPISEEIREDNFRINKRAGIPKAVISKPNGLQYTPSTGSRRRKDAATWGTPGQDIPVAQTGLGSMAPVTVTDLDEAPLSTPHIQTSPPQSN